ncbi:MAG: hypothetical protein AAGH41_00635 [Pseudomonadota bacterium]
MRWTKLCAALAAVAACSGGDSEEAPMVPLPIVMPQPETPPFAIAGLPAGNHAGYIIGFDPLDTARQVRVTALLDEATATGNTLSRVQLDWAELEPSPGMFDRAPLDEALAAATEIGTRRFVLVSTLDTGVLTIPEDFLDDGALRPGLRLSDEEVAGRFEAFLDWLLPILTSENVWGLSIANEGETLIEDGTVSSAEAETFVERGLRQIADDAPELARGVTLTFTGPEAFSDYAEAVLSNSNLAIYNYYCLDETLVTTRRPVWESATAAMRQNSGDLPIMLQELGCPVGYEDQPSDLQSAPSVQADFFDYFAEVIRDDQQFRAVYAFQLLDWSPELAASFVAPVREEGEQLAADRLEEWLATSGLCSWSEDLCRPGWQSWLDLTEAAAVTQQ